MSSILLGVLALLALVAFHLRMSGPVTRRRVTRQRMLEMLKGFFATTAPGSSMVIKDENSDRFVQFGRVEAEDGRTNTYFAFPDVDYSGSYLELLSSRLEEKGIDHSFVPTVEDPAIGRFLTVDFIGTPALGEQIMEITLEVLRLQDGIFAVKLGGKVDPQAVRSDIQSRMNQAK